MVLYSVKIKPKKYLIFAGGMQCTNQGLLLAAHFAYYLERKPFLLGFTFDQLHFLSKSVTACYGYAIVQEAHHNKGEPGSEKVFKIW